MVAARGGATGLEVTPQVRAGEVLAIDAKGYFFLDATGAVTWSAEVPPGVQAGEVPRKVRFENGVLYVALGPKVWGRESSM